MSIILQADSVKKSYFTKPVLNGISLAIEEGSILGLLLEDYCRVVACNIGRYSSVRPTNRA